MSSSSSSPPFSIVQVVAGRTTDIRTSPEAREEPLSLPSLANSGSKSYDYLLKVLLVGDSDVGKQEILSGLEDGSVDSPYCSSTGAGMIEKHLT